MQIALLSTQHTLYAALKTALGANFEIYQIQDQYSVEEFLSGDPRLSP